MRGFRKMALFGAFATVLLVALVLSLRCLAENAMFAATVFGAFATSLGAAYATTMSAFKGSYQRDATLGASGPRPPQ